MRFSVSALAATMLSWSTVAECSGFKYERLDRETAALAIIDHQVGLFQLVHDFEPNYYKQQVWVHAKIAKAFNLPVILSTSAEYGPTGPLPPELIEMFPDAPLIRRNGEVNAMDDPAFREALAGLNRTQVLIAGIATDVCTTFAALSMREAGYSVFANAEASGTTSTHVRDIANDRMRDAGVQLLSPFAIIGELMRDWRSPPTGLPIWPLLEDMFAGTGMLARAHGYASEYGIVMDGQNETRWGVPPASAPEGAK